MANTTSDKLQYTQTWVQDAYNAVNEKGVNLPNDSPLENLGNSIRQISSGGETDGEIAVRFMYLDSKTGNQIIETKYYNKGDNAEFPDIKDVEENEWHGEYKGNPALTFQEWNHTQEELNNLQQDYDVGAIYIPSDNKTYFYISVTKTTGANATDALTQIVYFSKNNTAELTIDWGDGTQDTNSLSGNRNISHKYADYGNYKCTMWISDGSGTYGFGGSTSTSVFIGGNSQPKKDSLKKLFIGNDVISLTEYAFYQCRSLIHVTIPSGVSSIGGNIFAVNSLYQINIPYSITSFGTNIFWSAGSLSYISLPNKMTSISNSCFQGCYLKKVIIPNKVTTIGTTAFYSTSLNEIIIPDSVTSISATAFGSASLTKYIFKPIQPPTLASTNVFSSMNSSAKIYVPDESIDIYKTATNWSAMALYIYPMSELEN